MPRAEHRGLPAGSGRALKGENVAEPTADRLAETEYAAVCDPAFTRRTRFGRFVDIPQFPGRRDAHQLVDVRCREDEIGEMLAELADLYPTDLPFRKLAGHDPATFAHVEPALKERNWSLERVWMMTHQKPPERFLNPDVHVEVVAPTSENLKRVSPPEDFNPERHAYYLSQDPRLGGEVLVAYLGGQPVGSTGWFVVDGVARYRAVYVHPQARGRGVASAMLQHVQNHPVVRAQDALTIHVGEEGPVRLYEALGFVKHSPFWEALRKLE